MNLVWQYSGLVLAFVCCSFAFWRGGRAEQIGAAIILVTWCLSQLVHSPAAGDPGFWYIVIDVIAMGAFLWLSFWSRQLWTLVLSALQIDAVLAHFTEQLTAFDGYSYATALGLWSGEGLLVCLIWGVISHRRRMRAGAARPR